MFGAVFVYSSVNIMALRHRIRFARASDFEFRLLSLFDTTSNSLRFARASDFESRSLKASIENSKPNLFSSELEQIRLLSSLFDTTTDSLRFARASDVESRSLKASIEILKPNLFKRA